MSNSKWITAERLSQSSESSSIIRLMFIDSVHTHYDILATKICWWCRWERWLMSTKTCGNIHPCLQPLINPPLSVLRSKVTSSCPFRRGEKEIISAARLSWIWHSRSPMFPLERCPRTMHTRSAKHSRISTHGPSSVQVSTSSNIFFFLHPPQTLLLLVDCTPLIQVINDHKSPM